MVLDAVLCEWWAWVAGDPCTERPELPVEVSLEVLERTVGIFQVPGGPRLDLRVDQERLFVHLPNGFRALPLPRSETTFFLTAARASFEVELDQDGAVTAILFRRGEAEPARSPRLEE